MNNEMIMKICTEIGVKPIDMVKGLVSLNTLFEVRMKTLEGPDHAVPQSALSNDGWSMSENTSRKVYSLTETDLENIKAILHEPPSDFFKTCLLKYLHLIGTSR